MTTPPRGKGGVECPRCRLGARGGIFDASAGRVPAYGVSLRPGHPH
jgi:hypothetical protein